MTPRRRSRSSARPVRNARRSDQGRVRGGGFRPDHTASRPCRLSAERMGRAAGAQDLHGGKRAGTAGIVSGDAKPRGVGTFALPAIAPSPPPPRSPWRSRPAAGSRRSVLPSPASRRPRTPGPGFSIRSSSTRLQRDAARGGDRAGQAADAGQGRGAALISGGQGDRARVAAPADASRSRLIAAGGRPSALRRRLARDWPGCGRLSRAPGRRGEVRAQVDHDGGGALGRDGLAQRRGQRRSARRPPGPSS